MQLDLQLDSFSIVLGFAVGVVVAVVWSLFGASIEAARASRARIRRRQ